MKFSFLHISDIHLDRPFSGLNEYSDNLSAVCSKAVERVLNNTVDFAIEKEVDFILIAGDTFDLAEQDFSSKLILKRAFQRLENANISVYLICGNHDPVNTYNKKTFDYDENSMIKIVGLNTERYAEIPLKNKDGEKIATLHALSFTEEKFNENPIKYFKPADNGFNIGLLHCDLNADKTSNYAPCLVSELKELKYDYFALGHIHLPTIAEDNIQYSGTIQGRNTKETGTHGIRYVKVENNIIVSNIFIPMDIIRYENVVVDITSANDSIETLNIIEDKIRERVSDNLAEIYLIRPYIKGYSGCFNEINDLFFSTLSERIKTDFNGKVYISQSECNISPKTDERILSEDSGISGEIYRMANDENFLENSYIKVKEILEKQLANCNFTEEEREIFKKKVINRAKEECKNISEIIYEDGNIYSN